MRKLNYFMMILLITGMGVSLQAQDTIRDLIISELRFNTWRNAYVELTNMGDDTLDLSEFYYTCARIQYTFDLVGDEVVMTYSAFGEGFPNPAHTLELQGTLPPGESYFVMAVEGGLNNNPEHRGKTPHSIDLLTRVADTVVHRPDWQLGDPLLRSWPYIPEWECWGFDTLNYHSNGTLNYDIFMARSEREAATLFWHSGDSISVLIDQCLLAIDWDQKKMVAPFYKSVAGVVDAAADNILVRKFSVKQGQTNWSLARGVDASTSEWMMYPKRDGLNLMGRETEGNHGDFHIDVSSDVYDIVEGTGEQPGSITVPWGTEKHDSIRLGLNLGPGMAWWYYENASFEDSLSTVCKDNDTLRLYAFGNDMEVKDYVVSVAEPAGDMVDVFARHGINWPELMDDPEVPFKTVGGIPYWVLEYESVDVDTIVNIPFATKVDTLLNLLEKAPNASWEIVPASGTPSNEVSYGDLLRITGGDGTTTKDYFLLVDDYEMSDNVELAAIVWPDKPFAFMEGWKGDTIPGFIATGTSYKVLLPAGTRSVPALVATTSDPNATLAVSRAVSLSGGVAERTTTFTVTSESDTTVRDIKVLFEVENPYIQHYVGHPFFSKFFQRIWWGSGMMEICNPSGELIDLSNYMIVNAWSETNPADAIMADAGQDSTQWLRRYRRYVPGMKYTGNYTEWSLNPRMLQLDVAVDPYVEAGDVLVFWKRMNNASAAWHALNEEIMEERYDIMMNSDFREPGTYANPWNEPIDRERTVAMPVFPRNGQTPRHLYYLFEITGDSVREGLKPNTDPADFTLVDVFGSTENGPWMIGNPETGLRSSHINNARHKRLPHIYKGVLQLGEGMQTDWHSSNHNDRAIMPDADRNESVKDLGLHVLDPITEQISTVTSLLYKIDIGFEGDLGIEGVSNSETVDQFIDNLIPADTGQVLTLKSADGTVVRAGGDAVAEGDSLIVVSRNGDNTTGYTISLVPLDGNATLTAVDGSGLTIEITGETGTVGGFTYGTTVRSILDNVNVPDLAMLNVVDAGGNLVPLKKLNADTVYVDLVATGEYSFEVIAQNGDKILYALVPATASSDAYVLSDIYTVEEEPTKVISQITEGIGVDGFLANLLPVEGATMKVYLFTGQERTVGVVSIDDVLEVTSEDGTVTVTYDLNFIGELTAYVTSDVFTVDQDVKMITVAENTTVEDLIAGLTPAPEAEVKLTDVDGNEKTTGTVLATDVLMVTSGDGLNEVTYSIVVTPSSVYSDLANRMRVYPNPASSVLYVEHVPAGTLVRLTDITGRSTVLKQAEEVAGGIDLSGVRNGIYFLSVELDGRNLATRKVVVTR